MSGAPSVAERLWRVRKHHLWIDAQLCTRTTSGSPQPGGIEGRGSEVELRFFYDGQLVVARRWPTRDLAVSHAEERLRELERVGWTAHW